MKIMLCLLFIMLLLIFPASASQAALSALRIWGLDVVPSLFPYMVLSKTLASALKDRNVPIDVSAWILGLLGGSPSGAAVLASGQDVPRKRLLALCALTGCISPMFLLNTVASWAKDAVFGRQLLASHLLGALLSFTVVFLFAPNGKEDTPISVAERQAGSDNPIAESIASVMNVGGCIVFFSVMAASCEKVLPFLSQAQRAVVQGILEASGGLHALLASPLPKCFQYTLCAGIAGFSGLSILLQNFFFLKPLGVQFRQLILFGILRAVISSAVMLLILFFS